MLSAVEVLRSFTWEQQNKHTVNILQKPTITLVREQNYYLLNILWIARINVFVAVKGVILGVEPVESPNNHKLPQLCFDLVDTKSSLNIVHVSRDMTPNKWHGCSVAAGSLNKQLFAKMFTLLTQKSDICISEVLPCVPEYIYFKRNVQFSEVVIGHDMINVAGKNGEQKNKTILPHTFNIHFRTQSCGL